MAAITDDRTAEQRETHTIGIAGTDSFLSGWGGARGGASVAIWAVSPDVSADRVESWVKRRGDMKNVRTVDLRLYKPRANVAHVHIYVVGSDHPSVKKQERN
jgi:hypothetical protein